MSLIPKFFMDSVVSIGVKNAGRTAWIATGFFIIKKVGEEKYQPYMVTNRHVVEGKDILVIRMKEKNTGELREFDMPITENGRKLYTAHENKNIDIAVITVNGGFISANNLSFSAFDINEHALASSEFIENGGDEGSYVYMLGFPMGLVNIDSNSPICRAGCIARIDPNEIKTTKKILLDIQNFPGNSGSPIISKPELVGIEGTKSLNKAALVGIVSGYIPYKERRYDPNEKKIVEVNSENSGIAVANPVELLEKLCKQRMQEETRCLLKR